MSQLKWDLQRVRHVLTKAHEAADSAKTGADRILQFGPLREACDWLVQQHYSSKRTETKLVSLALGVISETKLFPPNGEPASQDKHYSVAHLGRFDKAVRALKEFVDTLARRQSTKD
ncbi:MAG: hypothetical protein P4L92_22995 [Rudaea sp.]|nr:hypothetical protein [Rudaea sp.]